MHSGITVHMHPEDKAPFLSYLDTQIVGVSQRVKDSEHARNISDSKMQSRYDTQKENHALDVSIGQGILDNLQKARSEIEEAPLRFRVEPGADVDVILNGESKRLLVLRTRVDIPGITVISPESPIGKAISEKITGDKATYTVGSQRFSVEIKGIL